MHMWKKDVSDSWDTGDLDICWLVTPRARGIITKVRHNCTSHMNMIARLVGYDGDNVIALQFHHIRYSYVLQVNLGTLCSFLVTNECVASCERTGNMFYMNLKRRRGMNRVHVMNSKIKQLFDITNLSLGSLYTRLPIIYIFMVTFRIGFWYHESKVNFLQRHHPCSSFTSGICSKWCTWLFPCQHQLRDQQCLLFVWRQWPFQPFGLQPQ